MNKKSEVYGRVWTYYVTHTYTVNKRRLLYRLTAEISCKSISIQTNQDKTVKPMHKTLHMTTRIIKNDSFSMFFTSDSAYSKIDASSYSSLLTAVTLQ